MRRGLWIQVAATKPLDALNLLDEMRDDRPGVVMAPEHKPDTLKSLYQRAREVTAVLIDPSGFLYDRNPRQRARRHYPWLAVGTPGATDLKERGWPRPQTSREWADWMRIGVEHQMSFDSPEVPSAHVIPTPQLEAAGGRDMFGQIADALDEVRGEYPDAWLGINIDRDYLREEQHLTRLANYLVSAHGTGILLRCFQSEMPPISDRRLLQGLSDVVAATAAEGTLVILPRSGWLGWLAMTWGAYGFSGGLGNGTWYDRMPTPMTNVPRREKIFERQLLRDVPWPVHVQLREQAGYSPCACSACDEMGGSYDIDLVRRHRILAAYEISDVGTADPAQVVTAAINQAIDFRNSLPPVLRDRVDAKFLDAWQALL